MSHTMTLTDSDKSTLLYTIEPPSRKKPEMTIRTSQPPSQILATATFHLHSFSPSSIDLTLHGRALSLKSRGLFKSGYSYYSPTANGAMRTWKGDSVLGTSNMECEDEAGQVVAKFGSNSLSLKKGGTLEVVRVGELDEIVGTGMAVFEMRQKKKIAEMEAGAEIGGAAGDAAGAVAGS